MSTSINSTPTPKIRFSEFNSTWNDVDLSHITEYSDYRGKSPVKTDKGIFLVTAKNIRKGYIDYENSKEYVSQEDYAEVMKRGLPKIGDVIFTTEAPLGNVAQVDNENIALAQRVIKFRTKRGHNNTFLKYYLMSDRFQGDLKQKATGGTVQGIKGSVLHRMKLHFPGELEQKKIADFLSTVDKWIENLRSQKEVLEKYKKGMMQILFSKKIRFKDDHDEAYPEWKKITLIEAVDLFTAPHFDVDKNSSEGFRLVDMGSVTSTGLLVAKKYTKNTKNKLNKNDLVMPNRDIAHGDIIGKVAIIDFDDQYVLGGNMYKITCKTNIPKYIYYLINNPYVNSQMRKKSNGTSQLQLIRKDVESVLVVLPSLSEQQKIAEFLTSVDKLIESKTSQITYAELWKKGLMQQMFV